MSVDLKGWAWAILVGLASVGAWVAFAVILGYAQQFI